MENIMNLRFKQACAIGLCYLLSGVPALACSLFTAQNEAITGHYPRFVELSNGTVLMSTDFTNTDAGRTGQAIRVYQGDKNLQNWKALSIPAFAPPVNYSNAQMVVLRAKGSRPETVLMAVRAWQGSTSWIDLLQSEDQGNTWKFRSQIFLENLADKTSGESDNLEAQVDVGVYEPMLWVSHNGFNPNGNETVAVVFASEVSANRNEPFANGEQVILLQKSSDLGFSWSFPTEVTPLTLHQRFGMPAIIGSGDTFVVFYEQVDLTPLPKYDWLPFYKKTAVWQWSIRGTVSQDAGKTWPASGIMLFDAASKKFTDNQGSVITYSGAPTAAFLKIPNTNDTSIGVVFQVGYVPSFAERSMARISLYYVGLDLTGKEFYRGPLPAPTAAWWATVFQNSSGQIIAAGDLDNCIQAGAY
jgi:hypothetical protein